MRTVRSTFIIFLGVATILTAPAWAQNSTKQKKDQQVTKPSAVKPGVEAAAEVPLLKTIPTLSFLFRNKEEARRHQESGGYQSNRADFPLVHRLPSILKLVQAETLLAKLPGLKEVEIVGTYHQKFARKSKALETDYSLRFSGSEEAEASARALMNEWRAQDKGSVTISYFLVERRFCGTPTRFRGDAADRPEIRIQKQGPQIEVMTEEAFEHLMSAARQEQGTQLTVMPSLTTLQGKTGRLTLLNQVSYIKDFQTQSSGNSIVADPIVGVIDSGIKVSVTPVIELDGNGVTLTCQAEASSLQLPMKAIEVQLAPELKMKGTIQIPERFESKVEAERIRIRGDLKVFRLRGLKRLKGEDRNQIVFLDLYGKVNVTRTK